MARLIVIDGPDKGKEFNLDPAVGDALVAGRDPRHPIALADTTVSREHFRIEGFRGGFRLVDLGSRNRTFLNGEPISRNALRTGDVIAVGDSELRFEHDAPDVPEDGPASTIIKEVPAEEGESIGRILRSLKNDPALRQERLRRAVDGLRELFRLSREILRSTSLDSLYSRLLEILVPALDADRGVVLNEVDGHWRPRSVYTAPSLLRSGRIVGDDEPTEVAPDGGREGERGESAPDLILMSETVVRRVAEEKTSILSTDTPADSRFPRGESIVEGDITTVIAAPILVPLASGKQRVAGVLYADRRGSSATGHARPPFTDDELSLLSAAAEQAGEVLTHLESELELRNANRVLVRTIVDSKRIVGDSEAIEEVHAFIRKAAPTPLTVLIRGETGTGKELVAAAIHYQSPRQGKPFVTINCAAIPENLIEAELFGYEKGAFTSATARKRGRFELADRGTIFLDELGELSLGCQAKLLRILEEQRFERVGGTQPVNVDVRIIAATNKDLAEAITRGAFREDLYYRINVLSVELPPLRQRPEDIPLLAAHFLNELGVPDDKRVLGNDVVRQLQSYSWPGNIRQLRNVVESAVVLGEGPRIRPEDIRLPEGPVTQGGKADTWRPVSLEDLQRDHIQRVLEFTGGNKKKASEILGIERCTLYSKLKSYGIQPKK